MKSMQLIDNLLFETVKKSIAELYQTEIDNTLIQIQKTRKEFTGDFTLVVFPFLKISKKNPEQTANEIGNYLKNNLSYIASFNIIKGFLNIEIENNYWLGFLKEFEKENLFSNTTSKQIMVEYSSPNTNKPLHLGHIRNNLLGYSIAEILKANNHTITKVNLVNDRGIHICKSMLAWQKFGNGATPQSANTKGDHLVGDYYVKFDKEYKQEIKDLIAQGKTQEEAEKQAPIILEAQAMLRKWEANDPATLELWNTMNNWVYQGFDETYKKMGVDFDRIYYESQTYLLGKAIVQEGLKNNYLYKKDDGSVWADMTAEGLDHKLLLRSDGTSVYMTQDIGTAHQRFTEYPIEKIIYVVGNEQEYHFKALSIVLSKLGYKWASGIEHMSYGMVELPEGKMKSREGTVVDADDLIEEMISTAREMSEQLGKLDGLSNEEKEKISQIIGLGALKYFILKVDPRKNMTFDPKESIDFNGNTGPFIQYTYARIRSVARKASMMNVSAHNIDSNTFINDKEKALIKMLFEFPSVVKEAGENMSPALIANYCYELVREYNQFYHEYSILREENESNRNLRLVLSGKIAMVIKSGMGLLGIEVPERM